MSPYPPLVQIGDITCTQEHVITPSGTQPIATVTWTFTDMSRTTQDIPTWAVVCAIVGFFFVCFLSLLFLLAKESKTQGWVQVTVQAPGFAHRPASGLRRVPGERLRRQGRLRALAVRGGLGGHGVRRRATVVLAVSLLLLAACGDDDENGGGKAETTEPTATSDAGAGSSAPSTRASSSRAWPRPTSS